MHAAMALAVNIPTSGMITVPSVKNLSKNFSSPSQHVTSLSIIRRSMRIQSQPTNQEYVNYGGKDSVFPAEACEEVGGDACNVEGIGPEVKPKPKETTEARKARVDGPAPVYVNYAGKRSVLPEEACDDLGGEFCEEK